MSTPKKIEKSEIHLTLGSKYRVLSLGGRDAMLESRGTFKGVVSVGTIDSVAIELDADQGEFSGKLRVIPSHMLLAVDILEQAKDKDSEKAVSDEHMHYG